MATLHDTALGTNDASGTTLATTDSLAVTAGDLIVLIAKAEGASTTITGSDGQSNTYAVANALLGHGNGDLSGIILYATASSTGTITPTATYGASRPFRKVKAYSFTPAASKTLQLDTAASATGTSSTPSAGTGTAAAAGATVVGFSLYGTRTITAGAGWSLASEFSSGDALVTEYQVQTTGGSLTGNATLDFPIEWVAQMAIFKEVATGSTYTITAVQGSYTLTGNDALLTATHTPITAAQGSYSLTGQDALFNYSASATLTASQGTYILVGADALVDVAMNADFGSYSLVGQTTALTYGSLTSYTLVAAQGSYTLNGQITGVLYGYVSTIVFGAYALTGRQAGLIWSGAPTSSGGKKRVAVSSIRMGL